MATAERLTERLRLRPIGPDSADEVLALHRDPGVAAWYGGEWGVQQALGFAADMGRRWAADGAGKWLAYRRSDGELVGRGGLSLVPLLGRQRLEVGWAVRQQLWGHGYAGEIGRAALALAFGELGATEVVAFTEVHNARSRAVMQRLGMVYLQEIRRPGLLAGSSEVVEDAPFAVYLAVPPD